MPNRIALDGEWDLSRKDELTTLLAALTTDRPATIDLRGVTYVDSSALNALGSLRLRFGEVPVTLLGANGNVERVLRIVAFHKIFRMVEKD